jgi:MSHA pilin protein MshD
MSMYDLQTKPGARSREQGAERPPGRSTHNGLSPRSSLHALRSLRGLSLIEVVAATLIVGMMSVAALNSLGAATSSAESIGNRAVGLGLAEDLMSEILQLPYRDPNSTPEMGPEDDEDTETRQEFDDVDDYHDWSEQPPQPKTLPAEYNGATSYAIGDVVSYQGASYVCLQAGIGNVPTNDDYWEPMPLIGDNRADWERNVTVGWVTSSDPTVTSASDQGVKRIRIVVEYRNQMMAELVALRTNSE